MGPAQGTFRQLVIVVVGFALVVGPAACGGDDGPDPEAAKAATATGEVVGTNLSKVVAQLREVLAANPALTVHQGLDRIAGGRSSLAEAGNAIDDMLARKGLGLPDMMFLFSEGVASRLPPVAGVVFEPNRRSQYEGQYERRDVMRRYANWAVIRAIFADEGPPKPFRSLVVEDNPPPPELLDPGSNIVVPYAEGKEFSALFGWITDDPHAGDALVLLTQALGL